MTDSEVKVPEPPLHESPVAKQAFMACLGIDITNPDDVNRVIAQSMQKRCMAQSSTPAVQELVHPAHRLETRRIRKDKHIKNNLALIAKKKKEAEEKFNAAAPPGPMGLINGYIAGLENMNVELKIALNTPEEMQKLNNPKLYEEQQKAGKVWDKDDYSQLFN